MDIIFVLIPIGLILLCFGIGAFMWAVRNHQFDDLDSPAHRILFDDPPIHTKQNNGDDESQQSQ